MVIEGTPGVEEGRFERSNGIEGFGALLHSRWVVHEVDRSVVYIGRD